MANAVIAKGNACIFINEKETEARLVFTPAPDGDGWDAAAINKLASEKQLGAFPDPKTLETFLVKAAKAKNTEPLELMYAQGIEPEEPAPEKTTWENLPVPGDMAPFQKETLAKAGPPEIIRVKVEKIKHEKTVKKPGALPFMAAKEEVEVTWEKKETRERVTINPLPKEIKYADRDMKIGAVVPAVPGKPGKSVFGRPIPPSVAEDSSFFLGGGIGRGKNELRALVSGFIRIGENWADIVPLAKHSWKITIGIDGLTPFFHFEPGDSRFALPKGEEILAEAVTKGAEESALIRAAELDKAIAEAVKTRTPLEAHSLFHVQEAEARVDINEDKTRASLSLRKGVAGALPLDIKAISLALKNSSVQGFDAEKLKLTISEFMQGKALELSDYLLAEGTPSTRGKDREVKVEAPLLSGEQQKIVSARISGRGKGVSPREDEIVGADTATGFAFVEKGALVAKVTPASEGEAGKDIFGNVIPGLPGNDPDIRLLRGLELHGDDITAAQNGLLIMEASEKSFYGEVIDYRDAKIAVHVSEDAMEAKGDFFREEGAGLPLTIDNIRKVFLALGLKKGVDWEEVERAAAQARAHGSVLGRVIARGEKPVAKGGSAVTWLVALAAPQPEADTSGGAFVKSSEEEPAAVQTAQIKAGTPIAEITGPAGEDRPGYDVKGMEILVNDAPTPLIEHDDSIREEAAPVIPPEKSFLTEKDLSREKGTRLIAARSGELRFDGKKLTIVSSKTIAGDAGPDTGDIKFSGEIQISGNVLPGRKVIGGSHIIVGGFAEGAFISAGGKAVITKGFKGSDRGILRARAGIVSAFVERAAVAAIGDIQLDRGSILSSIKTNGKLEIVSESGKLSGGVCQARQGIDAANVGSEKGTRTEISFGQNYLIKDEINACEEEAAKLTRALSTLEEKIKNCIDKKLSIPGEVKKEKIRLVKLQEQVNLKLFTLREKFEEHSESEVRIRGIVFPGVVIESHNRYYEIKQKRSGVSFFFDRESGRIKEKPIN